MSFVQSPICVFINFWSYSLGTLTAIVVLSYLSTHIFSIYMYISIYLYILYMYNIWYICIYTCKVDLNCHPSIKADHIPTKNQHASMTLIRANRGSTTLLRKPNIKDINYWLAPSESGTGAWNLVVASMRGPLLETKNSWKVTTFQLFHFSRARHNVAP